MGDPTTVCPYPTRPIEPSQQLEYWVRGKTLGGSTAALARTTTRSSVSATRGGGWDDMLPVDDDTVDSRLRVRGATNLRVVDASVRHGPARGLVRPRPRIRAARSRAASRRGRRRPRSRDSSYWPKQEGMYAELINPIPKFVASRTIQEPLTWNARLLGADPAEAVAALKADAGELPIRLRLIAATTFSAGVVRLSYQPLSSGTPSPE